jgi:hypothetical protein
MRIVVVCRLSDEKLLSRIKSWQPPALWARTASWKGLFWRLNYRLVNGLTCVLGIEGKYMVPVAQKPATG